MSGQSQRILVVDDTPEVVTVLRDALQRVRYPVDTASSAAQGLSLLSSGGYSMVLCDLQMPDVDGGQFCRRVLGGSPNMQGRLVLMTGGLELERATQGSEAGAVRTLSKPFTLAELYGLVSEIAGPPPSASGDGSVD